MAATPHDDWAAQGSRTIGPYRLVEIVGEGGMGTVWLAEQIEPVRREVALKVVRSDVDIDDLLARFDAERQVLALMSHPNVARVYDAGRAADGTPYIAMEFVHGLPFTEFCDRRELALRDRLLLLADVCRGVHHAHQKGVLHRDLKPTNVLVELVDGRPVPKIIDFGVAKALQPVLTGSTFAERGRFVGTPAYIAPEQADPTALGIDSRADVYSLGVMLYELLVGELPFDPRTLSPEELPSLPQLIRQHTPPRPSTKLRTARDQVVERAAARRASVRALRRSVRGDLDAIAMKALAKDPEQRYASASELAADIDRFLGAQPVSARTHTLVYGVRKFIERNRTSAAAVAAVAAAAVASFTVCWREYVRARASEIAALQSRALAEMHATEAREALARALAAEADARNSLERAQAARREADGRRLGAQSLSLVDEVPTLALLLAIEGAERAPGEETSTALYRALEHHHEIAAFDGHDGPVRAVALSLDERSILSGDDSGLVLLRDAATGAIRLRFDVHTGIVDACGFLPDGKHAFSTALDGTAVLWDCDSGAEVMRAPHPAQVRTGILAKGGALLCTSCDDGVVRVWPTHRPLGDTHPEPIDIARHALGAPHISASGDGRRVASAGVDDLVFVSDLTRDPPVTRGWSLAEPGANGRGVDSQRAAILAAATAELTPNADRLLTCSRSGRVVLWNATDGAREREFAEPSEPALFAQLTPDGRRALVVRSDAKLGRLVAESFDVETGRRTSVIGKPGLDVRSPCYLSPDGGTLLSGNGESFEIWDVATGTHRGRIIGSRHGTYNPRFFSDGRRFVAGGHDYLVRIYSTSVLREDWALSGLEAAAVLNVRRISDDGELAVVSRSSRDTIEGAAGGETAAAGDAGMCSAELVDAPSARRLFELSPPRAADYSGEFDRSGSHLVLVWSPRPGSADRGFSVWDLSARRLVFERRGAYRLPRWSGDASKLAITGESAIEVIDARSGRTLARIEGAIPGTFDLDLSADGSLLATSEGGRRTAAVWDVSSGSLLHRIDHNAFVFSAVFDARGDKVLSFANDTTAKISDARTGRTLGSVPRLTTAGYGRALWHPDGRRIAVATPHELVLADAASGAVITRWKSPSERAWGEMASFSPDGRELLSMRGMGVVRHIPLDPLAAARAVAPRELSSYEMATFGIGTSEERAARSAEQEERLASASALIRRVRSVADAGDFEHALALLERAKALRRRTSVEYEMALLRVLCLRCADVRVSAATRESDAAQACTALRRLIEQRAIDRSDLQSMRELDVIRQHPEFPEIVGASRR